jgi:hypothetical protein
MPVIPGDVYQEMEIGPNPNKKLVKPHLNKYGGHGGV